LKNMGDGTWLCPRCEEIVGEDKLLKVNCPSRPNGHAERCVDCEPHARREQQERYLATEKGRLTAGKCTQRGYLRPDVQRYFSRKFN
jgi:hypothetical protein